MKTFPVVSSITRTVSELPVTNPMICALPVITKLPLTSNLPTNEPVPLFGKKFSPTKSPAFKANEAVDAYDAESTVIEEVWSFLT